VEVNILGVCHDVFICSACVLIDGEIVAAIPEERLDRNKRSRVFPTRAIQECLRIAGLDLEDIEEIAIAWNPMREAETTPAGFLDARRWRSEHLTQVPSAPARDLWARSIQCAEHRGTLGRRTADHVRRSLSHPRRDRRIPFPIRNECRIGG